MFAFGLSIFTGAFLLFLVQPLIGKFILPWFGGTPAVWTTCMLFFQLLLVGGYAYAHASTRYLKPRRQVHLHLALLALSLLLLPITPGDAWKPLDSASPIGRILLLLTVSLGLPYLVLSATGPLMQAWFSQTHPHRSPYRLYALSNAGSFLALICYPLFVEPNFSRRAQANGWSLGLGAFAAIVAWCGLMVAKRGASTAAANPDQAAVKTPDSTPIGARILWFALPACGSVLLLSVTNKICQDVAVVPFLWILPLSLYLISFGICFERALWYQRTVWLAAWLLLLAVLLWLMLSQSLTPPSQLWLLEVAQLLEFGKTIPMFPKVGVYLATMFVGCMVCHGEVFRLRPATAHLTGYYLMIAVGGAFGGWLVAVVAPWIFRGYYELYAGLFALSLLAGAALFVPGPQPPRPPARSPSLLALATAITLALSLVAVGGGWYLEARSNRRNAVELTRNFYGPLRVWEQDAGIREGHKFYLTHGATTHGLQFQSEDKRRIPTTYYSAASGIGRTLANFPRKSDRRIGLVGLGVGTLAAYGQPGDYFRIYEINEEVIRLARERFTYLRDTQAKTDMVLGDARLSLEREAGQQFDVLALDAFSSDAIPVHLLTREAFEVYGRHLKPDGVIAVHISNRYLDLKPVLLPLAEHFGLAVAIIDTSLLPSQEDARTGAYQSTWVLLSKNREFMNLPEITAATRQPSAYPAGIKMWTDDESDLFRILIIPKH